MLLVTSPGPAEGKSISAVNLAAAFAETGATVIVIDADFRRPTMHRYFHKETTPNLGDLTPQLTPEQLAGVLQETGIPGVRFAASAPSKSDPGAAMAVAKAAANAAIELADVVLLDSPPLLLANDASDLATLADATVLLARSGWTRRGAIVAASDLLRRLEATVVGVVLVGADRGARAGYYGYYGYYGYGYGYAHPEQNVPVKRLLPWGRGRRVEPTAPARSPSADTADVTAPPATTPEPASSADDEPWV
jgi:capsular exopolysaccharide synthesis family protein